MPDAASTCPTIVSSRHRPGQCAPVNRSYDVQQTPDNGVEGPSHTVLQVQATAIQTVSIVLWESVLLVQHTMQETHHTYLQHI